MKKAIIILLVFTILALNSCSLKNNTETINPSEKPSSTDEKKISDVLNNTTSLSIENDNNKFFYQKEIKVDKNDPYSALIKEKCEKFSEVWASKIEEYGNTKESFDYVVKFHPDLYFFLYDLDGDGTKELLLGGYVNIGDYSEEPDVPKKLVITSAYTIKDHKVIEINTRNFWSFNFIWDRVLLSNGKILTTTNTKEDPDFSFISYKNGKVSVSAAWKLSDTEYMETYDPDKPERKISTDEYRKLYKRNYGDAEIVNINWQRIDKYGM